MNARDYAGVDFIDALRMASFNPAHALGLRLLGGILPGTEPDIILMDEFHEERSPLRCSQIDPKATPGKSGRLLRAQWR